MPDDVTTSDIDLAGPRHLQAQTRRLGLVGTVAVAAMAVIALAWVSTPATASAASTQVLGLGALGVLSLSVLAIGAAHRRTHRQLTAHAELFEESRTSAGPTPESKTAGDERLTELETRLSRVEEMQNEHLVELIDATDPPTGTQRANAVDPAPSDP